MSAGLLTLPASIVIPTRARPGYLAVALASIAPQVTETGAELLVIDDAGPSTEIRELARRFHARYEPHPEPLGLNVARNTGVALSKGDLVVFVDDDVEVSPGWLQALLSAAREHPEALVLTGPIRPRMEGPAPHSCGREGPPITSLDLGPEDTDRVRYAWGANLAIRRSALEQVGPFDPSLVNAGDEQEWQDRLRAHVNPPPGSRAADRTPAKEDRPAGPIRYVARASVYHRRAGDDARLRNLARAARARGRASRRFDAWRGEPPPLPRELRTLLGCLGHVIRYRCPAGLTMVGHSVGRLEEGLREGPSPGPSASRASTGKAPSRAPDGGTRAFLDASAAAPPDDFLSGASGTVGGLDAVRREVLDRGLDAWGVVSPRSRRLEHAARAAPPPRRVLVVSVVRPERAPIAEGIRAELARSRHHVEFAARPPGELGKFENLNLLLAEHPLGDPPRDNASAAHPLTLDSPAGPDWLLVVDDDVLLPHGFLDRFLFLAERFSLDLAQPAHRANSHAAWAVTRRRPRSLVRETRFVEIGPVTAFARSTFSTLLPFPPLRMGWGLDLHWAALARERGWRCGVVDAAAIGHSLAPAAEGYSREAAVREARAFLAERPYVKAAEASKTLLTHRRW